MASVLSGALQFMNQLGIYDVVLPFLLVFTIVFAMLERTQLFGLEKDKKTKKNLNSMVAFVMGFFVIASAQLVEAVTKISSHAVLLLMLSVLFMLLVGSFHEADKPFQLPSGWNAFFMIIMFLGIVGIFLNALTVASGETWLEVSLNFIQQYYTDTAFATVLLLAFIIGAVVWITNEPKPATT